jgi:hypothetical protein
MRHFIVATVLILFSLNGLASAAEENDIFEIETEGGYRMASGGSVELAKEVALFSAKRKAVDLAGRYLSRRRLIKTYELNRDEIYSLAAREVQSRILEEKREADGKTATYRLKIRSRVQASDFVKAEIEDARQEKKETHESFYEEMEQRVAPEIDPGKDIAKAYRLLREKKWRITMIYLNHLEKKYPNWDSIQMAKAITHYILHEPEFMKAALEAACRLGNTMACDDLRDLKKVNAHDFGLSIMQ